MRASLARCPAMLSAATRPGGGGLLGRRIARAGPARLRPPPAAATRDAPPFMRGLPVPGLDAAMDAFTGGLDAASADGSLVDVELRDVAAVSYVSRRRLDEADFDPDEVDEEGLPLIYNEDKINAYWAGRLGELASRWGSFAGIAAPWLTRLATAVVRSTLERDRGGLARDAVDNLEKLGPTYVKLGQILSIR